MSAELGHYALVLALGLAFVQGLVPIAGSYLGIQSWMAVATPAARGQTLFTAVAYAALTAAFINSDFSVAYVAQNSNADLPLFYRIAGVWGAHEGSVLLWALILGGWTVAVSFKSHSMPPVLRARVLSIMGLISAGFLLFIALTSNPFERLLPAPLDGRDLNPLLQDPGMVMHPPMLYMGYVGLVVPFAFACASLMGGRIDAAWTRWTRPWTTVAWVFLTVGITLGSWWAYNELGWGGWWFWDPVENASFMPWLVATALMHSLVVTEQRGAFRAWTVLLAIFGFSLSLLGTFLVRSGVLVSVHAFATDPERGSFILVFLGLVVGGALALYAWRAPRLAGGGSFALLSRETLLLVNNVMLVVASGSILLGTLYPLILDALDAGKISVGPPYFNSVFVPLMVPVVLLVAVAPLSRWKADSVGRIAMRMRLGALVTVAGAGIAVALVGTGAIVTAAALVSALWVVAGTTTNIVDRMGWRSSSRRAAARVPRGFVGMCVAHLGVAVVTAGIAVTSAFTQEADVRLAPGESYTVAGYEFRFEGVTDYQGPNYRGERGRIVVTAGGDPVTVLFPEKRHYPIQSQPMTEAAVDAGLSRDLYVALGDSLGDGAWAVRAQYKPMVRWIWLGGLMMALGGLIAVTDRRYRSVRAPVDATASAPSAAAA